MADSQSILLIEDNESQRGALAELLRARNYLVRAAGDCEEGLALLDADPKVHVVLLDWVLPQMSGWGFLTQIRKNPNLAALPLIVISGYPERAEQASILSGVTFLPKPIDEEKLFATIAQVTSNPPPQVLLVDDDAAVGEVLAFNLRHFGLAVRQVTSGRQAVDVYQRHGGSISLVLLDVQMPDLDGPHAMDELRKLNPQVKVVFMSGHTGNYSTEELLQKGALRVLQKPFSFQNKLAELLRQLAQE